MKKKQRSDIKDKLNQINKETTTYLNEIKQLISAKSHSKKPSIIGYFTHSTNVTNKAFEPNIILGNLKVLNIGQTTINNLVICLNMNFSSDYDFSGKYILENEKSPVISAPVFWALMEQKDHVYWFKLLKEEPLNPGESVTFSDFNIRWQPKESYTSAVRGFIYCEEIQEGISVINPISLSGTIEVK